MKAKVIETGEIVNVLPYPTIYQEKGQGPDRREWYEDDLEFEPVPKRVSLDEVCEWLDGVIYDYITLEHANVDTYLNVDNERFIKDLRKAMGG
jgi:hypothetical protein